MQNDMQEAIADAEFSAVLREADQYARGIRDCRDAVDASAPIIQRFSRRFDFMPQDNIFVNFSISVGSSKYDPTAKSSDFTMEIPVLMLRDIPANALLMQLWQAAVNNYTQQQRAEQEAREQAEHGTQDETQDA